MKGTDALESAMVFGSIGVYQSSPPLAFMMAVLSVGVVIARRSPAVQQALLGDAPIESRAARYFFKTPPAALPAPRTIAPPDERAVLAPRQPSYPAPVQVRTDGPTRPTPTNQATPMARVNGWDVELCFGNDLRGNPVYAPVFHGAILKSTGGGKTNLADLIVGQLLGAGVDVWAATPKYVPIDRTDGLERRAIYDRIPAAQRALRLRDMDGWLERTAKEVFDRYDRIQDEPGWFPQPMVVMLEEIKSYFSLLATQGKRRVDEAEGHVKTMLTLGREAGVYIIFTSQDGYCGSVSLTRGEINNLGFRLVHPATDDNSRKNFLPERLPSGAGLGPHDWFCARGDEVQVVRVPRVSAQMIADWGLADAPVTPTRHDTRPSTPPVEVDPFEAWQASLLANAPAANTDSAPDLVAGLASLQRRGKLTKATALLLAGGDEAEAVRALNTAGMAQRDIVKLWGGNTQATNRKIGAMLGNTETLETGE